MYHHTEDPSVNGPDYLPGRWAVDEPREDESCHCDSCRESFDAWVDPEDGLPVTWCCKDCWAE